MTEVTNYPNPHQLGAPSHRLLAPAPAPKTSFFAHGTYFNMSFQPPASASYYGPPQPSMARSPSVSSTTSSASFNAASSRTLSPALSASESTIAIPTSLPRRHSQQLVHRSPYQSHTQASFPYPSPSQYLPRQPAAQYPLYASVPTPQPFPQALSFGFRQDYLPQQPQATSFESYPTLTTSAYQVPYQQGSLLQQNQHQQQYNSDLWNRVATLDPKILENIVQCLGELDGELEEEFDGELDREPKRRFAYLDVIRLSMVNRFFYHHIAQNNFAMLPGEPKHRLVLHAETQYKRYYPRIGGQEGGQDPSDGTAPPNSLGCYHCFKIKGPAEFELFRYTTTTTTEEDEEPERDTTPYSQRPAGLPTANPHYDPSITRSSIKANSRGASTNQVILDQSSPRIKETWGIRRFCIDCGVKKQYYRPGALIELRNEKPTKEKKGKKGGGDGKDGKEAKWVCDCLLVHKRPEVLQCRVCGMMTPFSQNRGGPLHHFGG